MPIRSQSAEQPRVVDLHQEAGARDGLVLDAQRLRECEHELLFALVVLVPAVRPRGSRAPWS